MSQANNDFDLKPELQKRDQRESPSVDLIQKPILKEPKNETIEWNMSPAELYGCLCHQPEYDKRKGHLWRG